MAKHLLKDFRIAGDIIDQVAGVSNPEPAPQEQSPPPESNSGATGPESRPAEDGADPGPPAGSGTAAASETPSASGQSQPLTDVLKVTRDGVFQVFTVGTTVYRVGGVKPLFVTSLRVNLRSSSGERAYYDSLDLYSAKARGAYASALNRAWGVEPSRVEKDLVAILEHLERDRDEQLTTSSQKPVITVSESDRQAGLELLKDPRLFDRIAADLSALGYVGEDLNKQLLYLCASSRKLDDPISVLILSQSASGKSMLVECVRKLMPSEEVVAVTSLSDQALNYIDDLMHKFLVLGEAVHGEMVEHQIREMLSGKELSRLVTIKDAQTGKMQSRIMRTPVIVASVMSGTSHAVNPENASRCFLVNTDESKGQTARIHEHQRLKYSLDRIKTGGEVVSAIIKAHQAAQRLLVKVSIVNDFAPLLDFPTSLMRLRRDHDRFLDLIACVCYLRQYQKTVHKMGASPYISCDLEDYRVAYRIMVEGVLGSTMREIPRGAQQLYDDVRHLARAEAKRQSLGIHEVSLSQRQIREATGLGQTWVRENLRHLVDYEYIVVHRGGSERSKGLYRVKEDAELASLDLSMIPTPEAMEAKMKEGRR